MAASGDEYQFPPPNLSARCGFSKQTFAGMGGKEEDAPIADLYATTSRVPRPDPKLTFSPTQEPIGGTG
jgi:hypothetical protein